MSTRVQHRKGVPRKATNGVIGYCENYLDNIIVSIHPGLVVAEVVKIISQKIVEEKMDAILAKMDMECVQLAAGQAVEQVIQKLNRREKINGNSSL